MLFSIGQMSKMYDISHDTLRYYDKIGLLKPSVKKENGYRYYNVRQIEILEIILIAKQLEIPIKQIKEIVDNEDVESYIDLFNRHEEIIENKIKHLNKLKEEVARSKNSAEQMKNFNNESKIEAVNIKKKILFYEQNGEFYIAIGRKQQNLMFIVNKEEDGSIKSGGDLVGIEINQDTNSHTEEGNIIKNYEGEYIVVSRKDTEKNIDDYIKEVITYLEKENINKSRGKKLELLMECVFVIPKNNNESIYLVNVYIPVI